MFYLFLYLIKINLINQLFKKNFIFIFIIEIFITKVNNTIIKKRKKKIKAKLLIITNSKKVIISKIYLINSSKNTI